MNPGWQGGNIRGHQESRTTTGNGATDDTESVLNIFSTYHFATSPCLTLSSSFMALSVAIDDHCLSPPISTVLYWSHKLYLASINSPFGLEGWSGVTLSCLEDQVAGKGWLDVS